MFGVVFVFVFSCIVVVGGNRCGGGALALCGMGSFDGPHYGPCGGRQSNGVTLFGFELGVCVLGKECFCLSLGHFCLH
jgi:hypothetical protein